MTVSQSRTIVESRPVKYKPLSHNLNGQRLGRKGRDTRDRIIAATQALLAGPQTTPITLSAVAREISLGMTSLYSYFNDLTALLQAVLEPVTVQAEDAYLAQLRKRWPDDSLYDHCLSFITAFHGYWQNYARILHLRNTMADRQDERMAQHRVAAATPVIVLFVKQMGHDPAM
ncbi:MAG: hypothetical protein RL367_2839, partial [Pseudomonadota bacterium]